MARAAIVREVCRDVTGIGCSIEIRRVAAVAVNRKSLEFPADVARNTVEFCVHAGQCEACDRRVIEGSAQPVVGAVTGLTSCGEVQGLVIDHAGGIQIIGHVAGGAVGAQAGELADGCACMTGNAVECGMSAEERETILMVLNVLDRDTPALDRVTFLAASSKLPAMKVCMAIGALRSHTRENWIRVAGLAVEFCVCAAKRKSGFLVAEVRKTPYGLPASFRVTAFTTKLQISVRTAGRPTLGCLSTNRRHKNSKQDDKKADLPKYPVSHVAPC